MEGTGGRPWLSRQSPRRHVLLELEQERPEPRAVAEDRFTSATVGVPEIVSAFRDRGQKSSPLANWLRQLLVFQLKIADCVPGGDRIVCVCDFGPLEHLAITAGDEECAVTALWHTVISGINHQLLQFVGGSLRAVDSSETIFDQTERRDVSLNEPRDILNEQRLRQKDVDQMEEVE